jgi:hypothetical protein
MSIRIVECKPIFFFGRAWIVCCHATQFILSFYFLKWWYLIWAIWQEGLTSDGTIWRCWCLRRGSYCPNILLLGVQDGHTGHYQVPVISIYPTLMVSSVVAADAHLQYVCTFRLQGIGYGRLRNLARKIMRHESKCGCMYSAWHKRIL